MFTSVASKFAAVAAVTAAIAALPAGAGALTIRPYCPSGPKIVINAADSYYLSGSCFAPGDSVDVWFWGNGNIVAEPVTVSASGTFTVRLMYAGFNGVETAEAFDFGAGTHSNQLTIVEPQFG